MLSIKSDIGEIKERITKTETQISSNITPNITPLDGNTRDIVLLQQGVTDIKRFNDIAIQTNLYLSARLEEDKRAVAQSLKEFLDKYAAGNKK
jgi:hypothetical protein